MTVESLEKAPEHGDDPSENGLFADLAVRASAAPARPTEGRSVPPPPPRSTWAPPSQAGAQVAGPRTSIPPPPPARAVTPDVTVEVRVDSSASSIKSIPALGEVVQPVSAISASIPAPPVARASFADTATSALAIQATDELPTYEDSSLALQQADESLSEAAVALADLSRLRSVTGVPVNPNVSTARADVRRDTSGTFLKAQTPSHAPLLSAEPAVPVMAQAPRQMAVDYTHVFQPASASVSPPARNTPYAALSIVALIALCFAWYVFDTKMVPGVVQLTTTPADALVFFDGAPVGTVSPFVKTGVRPSAKHVIEVRKVGYRAWRQEVELQPGQTLAFDVKLPDDGSLVGANEVRVEHAPVPKEVVQPAAALPPTGQVPAPDVAPEPVALEQPRSTRTEPSAEPARTPRATRRVSAEPAAASGNTGILRVSSRPWSVVFVDGKNVGNTPQTNLTLTEGKHEIRLKNPEFDVEKTVTVDITANKTETLILNLL